MHASYLCALAVLLGGPSPVPTHYESPPVLRASQVLPGPLLRGPHHVVREEVPTDGLLDVYTLDTAWGAFEARGAAQLRLRVREAEALAQLDEVDEAAVAAGALGAAALDVARGAARVVTKPVETAKGVGGGVKRLGGRLGRSARRAVEQGKEAVDEDDPSRAPEGEPRSREEAAQDAATGVARSLLGVTKAYRDWARRLEVDPYTDNEPLRAGLERVARYDAAGRFAFRIVPLGVVGTVAGKADSVSDLVYGQDPDALSTLNEERLRAMEVPVETSREFRLNARLSLSGQVRLVHALHAIGPVQERARVVARAAAAPDKSAARFFEESAQMLLALHEQGVRPRRILDGSGPLVAHTHDGAAILVLPADHASWTEELARYEEDARMHVKREVPGSRLEVRLTGLLTERAREELQSRGWTVHEAGGSIP
jgi:hypothetical protein